MSNEQKRPVGPNDRAARQAAAKKKKRRKKQIQRIVCIALIAVALLLVIILALKFLAGAISSGKAADVTTLTLKEDGKVIYEEVVELGDVDVTEKELTAYAKEELEKYNKSHGSESVKLNKINVDDGVAYQKTTYKDVTCYHDFSGYELYSGKVSDAKAAGYDFATTFISAYRGMTGDEINADVATNDSGLSVLIIRENGQVTVPGSIRFISANGVRLIDEDTAEVYPQDESTDAAVLAYIIYEE